VSETPNHNLLTVKETAEYLRIPLPTVYYLVQRGQIPAIQIGGRWRIKKSSLDRDILRQDKQGQPTVLVVDDDPDLQELFKAFLKKIGFSRVVVGTAKDAISSLRKQKFDLMFLDLQLPDAPGDQVYKTAKHIDPDLNVIVITGYPDSEVLDRILQISPVTVLKKPLKIEQLNQTVKILGHITFEGGIDLPPLVTSERSASGRYLLIIDRSSGRSSRSCRTKCACSSAMPLGSMATEA
jgi:excisionase family DNA binding protein